MPLSVGQAGHSPAAWYILSTGAASYITGLYTFDRGKASPPRRIAGSFSSTATAHAPHRQDAKDAKDAKERADFALASRSFAFSWRRSRRRAHLVARGLEIPCRRSPGGVARLGKGGRLVLRGRSATPHRKPVRRHSPAPWSSGRQGTPTKTPSAHAAGGPAPRLAIHPPEVAWRPWRPWRLGGESRMPLRDN